jgi:hypothetical protein
MFKENEDFQPDYEQSQYMVASCTERKIVHLLEIDEDGAETLKRFREANEAEGFRTTLTIFDSLEPAEALLKDIQMNFARR